MYKARIAAVSSLAIVCLCVLEKQVSALLAAAASAIWLVGILVRAQTIHCRKEEDGRRRQRRRFRERLLQGALLVLLPSLSWATFGTSFRGVTAPLPTGGLTLSSPWAVAVDGQGNVFIADTVNARVVEVTAAGVASVISFPGLSPALSNPSAVAVDGSGNLYVSDSAVPRVVELSAGVATVVPTASLLSSPSGLAIDGAGDLYIADQAHDYIVKVPAGGMAAVFPITGVVLGQPWGLGTSPSGNLYVADKPNNRIVVVTPGGAGSILAIGGGLTLSQPTGVAVDGWGNVYIGDTGHNRIVTVDSGGNPTVLNTGVITPANPKGVAVSPMGAVYFADTGNSQVVYAQPTTVNFGHLPLGAHTGTTLVLPFTIGFGVTFGSVRAYTIGAAGLDFTLASTTCIAGVTSNGPCTATVTFLPGAAGLRRGEIVLYNNAIPAVPILSVPLYAAADAPLATLSPGTAALISTGIVTTTEPFQIALDGAGNFYVGDYSGGNVVKVPPAGGSAAAVSTGGITLGEVAGVALDGAGNLFISDHFNNRIVKVTPSGAASVLSISGLSSGLNLPAGLAIDAAGNLYISDYGSGRVLKLNPAGLGFVVGTGSFTSGPDSILGVAVDSAGTVYFPDSVHNRVIKVTAAGAASLVVSTGITPALSSPDGVVVDSFDNLYIADAGNQRIVQVTTAGLASVIPTPGLTGPPALGAYYAVAVDSGGNILVPDFTYNRLVKVNVASATLAFPNTSVGSSSSAKTATMTNQGDLPLLFALSPGYTANFSQPSGATGQCLLGTSVAAGIACDVSISFTPQSAGPLSASLVLTDNNLNLNDTTENVLVSGTGVAAPDTTATSVAALPVRVILGQPITITATVTDTELGHTRNIPTGGVSFTDSVGSTVISLNGGSPVALNGTGNAILPGVILSGVGRHTITANYLGFSNVFVASSGTTSIAVSAIATTTVLTGNPNPVVAGQILTLSATVAPVPTGSPLGSIGFYLGATLLGSGSINSSGIATFTTSSLPVGTLSLTAVYSGNASFASSTSATWAETVAPASVPTSTVLNASPNPQYDGQPVTLTATVRPAPSGNPAGIVSFYFGVNLLGSGPLSASGRATLTLNNLAVGADTLNAVYPGNPGFAASTSQIIERVNTAYTITGPSAPVSVAPGGSVKINLKVPPLGGPFNSPVNMSATGLPSGATATFNPSKVTPGVKGAATVMTVELAPLTAGSRRPGFPTRSRRLPFGLFSVAFVLFGIASGERGGSKRISKRIGLFILLAIVTIATSALTGCGGFAAVPPPANYAITITGTSGSFHASTTVTLTVE